MKARLLVVAGLLCATGAFAADETPAKPNRVERAVQKTGQAIDRAAKKTAKAIDHAAKKTGDWLKKKTE